MQLVTWYVFIAAHAVLAACLVAFVCRQKSKEYPIFLAYAVCELAIFLVAYTLDHLLLRSLISSATLQWTSGYLDLIPAALELAVLYELADNLILSRSFLGSKLRPVLRWSGAVLLLIAAAVSVFVAHPGLDPAENAFEMLHFASHLIVFGILFILLVFSHALQVPWRSLAAGIALGLGVSSSLEIASSGLVSALGAKSLIPADFIRMSVFLLCTIVWLVYILLPDRSVLWPGNRLGKAEIEFWDQELGRMVQ